MRYGQNDIKKLGTIVGIWAHPDDESWSSAGIMATAVKNGQRVVCITATKGEAGQTADEKLWPKSRLGEVRSNELAKALEILGVSENYWLDYADGELARVNKRQASEKIAKIIAKVKPKTVLTFGPDGITGHEDHCTICDWACAAVKKSGCDAEVYGATEVKEHYYATPSDVHKRLNIYFNTVVPKLVSKTKADICYEPPESVAMTKLDCLKAHASQTKRMFDHPNSREFAERAASCECFMRLL